MAELGVILIADDNADDALLVEKALREAGVRNPIEVVEDGAQALEYLAGCEEGGLPVLALIDVRMPVIDGLGVLSWLNRRPEMRARVRVVILASSMSAEEGECARGLRADGFIEKPLSFLELEGEMRKVKEQWLCEGNE